MNVIIIEARLRSTLSNHEVELVKSCVEKATSLFEGLHWLLTLNLIDMLNDYIDKKCCYRSLSLTPLLGLGWCCSEVVQSALNGRGDWRRCGEMSTLGLEAILIGDIGQRNVAAVISCIMELALNIQRWLFSASVLQGTTLLRRDTVSRLVWPRVRIWVNFALLFKYWNFTSLLRSCERDRNKGKEYL